MKKGRRNYREIIKEAEEKERKKQGEEMDLSDDMNYFFAEQMRRSWGPVSRSGRIWIVPDNDLESKTIIELLQRRGEIYYVTRQQWGASWDMLEPEIFEQLSEDGFEVDSEQVSLLRKYDKQIEAYREELNSISDDLERKKELEEAIEVTTAARKSLASDMIASINTQAEGMNKTVYGVELQGSSRGATNIDHHIYGDDDRSNPKSSIEQVGEITWTDLSLDERFVAANDKGYIPEMERLGHELGINEEDLQEIISNIRMRDREAQGVTPEQELQVAEAVEKLGEIKGKKKFIRIRLPHSKTSTVTDRLYGKYENLLITSDNGETNFFGATEIINMLNEEFKEVDEEGKSNCWSGGQLEQGSGFWGGRVDQYQVVSFLRNIFERENGHRPDPLPSDLI